MPWQAGPTDPKYQTKEHRAVLASYKRDLKRDGFLICTATECVMPSRHIINPRGRERDGLQAGHDDDGVTYRGPQHNACNVTDGAKRGRARQDVTPLTW